MINYEYKSKILNSAIFQEYRKYSKVKYQEYCELMYDVISDGDNTKQYSANTQIGLYYEKNFPNEWNECKRISKAHYKRVKRLKERIANILLSGDCLFLTFTFNDEKLNSTSAETRRDKVKRFLTALECPYVANIDYGKTNHREHYHAVVGISRVDYSNWHYGAINGLRIRNNTNDLTRLSKYIAKLTNHAIKETTKRSVIMYSKKY